MCSRIRSWIASLALCASGEAVASGTPLPRRSAPKRWPASRCWTRSFAHPLAQQALFQGGALFDSMTVWQNVAFRLLRGSLKRPTEEAREIAIEKLRRVGLTPDVADLFPSELSGGMQKRVGLARAIAAEPEIIFFDEPTTGLDPIMSGVINDLIREIVVEMGATAMTITHDMSSVRAIADNVAMLHGGVIQWSGPVADMDASGDPYLTQFIAGSADGPIEAVR